MLESQLFLIVFGIIVGVLLTAKSPRDLVAKLDENAPYAYAYLLLGLLIWLASWALGWMGFTACITTFVLYQVFGRHGMPDFIQKIIDKRKKNRPVTTTTEAVLDDQLVSIVRTNPEGITKAQLVGVVRDQAMLNVLDPVPDTEEWMTAALARLMAANRIESDGDGKYHEKKAEPAEPDVAEANDAPAE